MLHLNAYFAKRLCEDYLIKQKCGNFIRSKSNNKVKIYHRLSASYQIYNHWPIKP